MPDFYMLPDMKTMFQGWFQAVSTGVSPYRQKSDFLSIEANRTVTMPVGAKP